MNEQANPTKESKGPPDFRLVVARLEKEIMEGKNPSRCRAILGRREVWRKLDAGMRVKWARLAQMTGEVELALEVFCHINGTNPERIDAWEDRLDLLSVLDRKADLVRVLAASRDHIGEERVKEWRRFAGNGDPGEDRDLNRALEPFDRLRQRETAVNRFLELFSGREECFARQWVNKEEGKQGYVPVKRPLEPADVEEHFSGRKTYGIYLLRSDSTVKTAVIDADLAPGYRKAALKREEKDLIRRERSYLFSRVDDMASDAGLVPMAEFSGGKGFHFWFFFSSPVPADKVRRPLDQISRTLSKDLTAFQLEVFPKQDILSGKGYGNLVKLPLGLHRLTGKRSYIVACRNRDVKAQLAFLQKATVTDPDQITVPAFETKSAEVFIHPRMKEWAAENPELHSLESLCPPVGQIIASCRNGNQLSQREEKVLFQTVGFLPRAKSLLHRLLSGESEYNPHLVDYKLSRLRGTPLGCRRIHSLLSFAGDICPFKRTAEYPHPLLHVEQWKEDGGGRSEKVEDLSSALDNLKSAISRAEAFLK